MIGPCVISPMKLQILAMERLQKRLALWKAKYLSFGGRITLIKLVLSNLPLYYLSLFKCPMEIRKRIEKLQRSFLWQGAKVKKTFHLVSWHLVCKSKKGLGIQPIKSMNQALLAKRLRCLRDEAEGLWKEVLYSKYSVTRGGWAVHGDSRIHSGIWIKAFYPFGSSSLNSPVFI